MTGRSVSFYLDDGTSVTARSAVEREGEEKNKRQTEKALKNNEDDSSHRIKNGAKNHLEGPLSHKQSLRSS